MGNASHFGEQHSCNTSHFGEQHSCRKRISLQGALNPLRIPVGPESSWNFQNDQQSSLNFQNDQKSSLNFQNDHKSSLNFQRPEKLTELPSIFKCYCQMEDFPLGKVARILLALASLGNNIHVQNASHFWEHSFHSFHM